jgi:hypothetical protein
MSRQPAITPYEAARGYSNSIDPSLFTTKTRKCEITKEDVSVQRIPEKGDWLRGAKRCGIGRNVTATVPVPLFRERIAADMKRLAPDAAVFLVSAVTGDGIPAAAEWLVGRAGRP